MELTGNAVAAGFGTLILLCALRVPVGLAMGAAGVLGFAMEAGFDPAVSVLSHTVIGTLSNYAMGLIPLFILMGTVAVVSGISSDLFRATHYWFGHKRGGLAVATIVSCGGFAAICGSSAATAATMTRVALPEMLAQGYSQRLATGTIAAGGTLGILIPPSIVLAVYGLLTEQSVGLLFMAGVLPGLLTIVLYVLVTKIWVRVSGSEVPPSSPRRTLSERLHSLKGVGPMVLVVVVIVGGLYGGVFTPTEAGAIGAASVTLIVALMRKRLNWSKLLAAAGESVQTASAIMLILCGAMLFSYFLAVNDVPHRVSDVLTSANLGKYGTLALVIGILIVLGCFLDAMAVILLFVPIVFPVISDLGFHPIWFGVIVTVAAELGMITPPFGLNAFVIKGIAKDISIWTIYKGVIPFILAQLILILLLVAFPQIALFPVEYFR